MDVVSQLSATERSQAQAFRGRATVIVLFYALFVGFLVINRVGMPPSWRSTMGPAPSVSCSWPACASGPGTGLPRRPSVGTGAARRDWGPLLLGLGVLSAGIGQCIWTVDEVILHQQPRRFLPGPTSAY